MGKRGPQCSICQKTAIVRAVGKHFARGKTHKQIGEAVGVSEDTVERHLRVCLADEPEAEEEKKIPPPPIMPKTEGLDDKAKAAVLVKYLSRQLRWLTKYRPDDPKLALDVSDSLDRAQKTLAKHNGAFEITETQIVRSTPWKRIMSIVFGVLEKHPQAALDLQRVLAELEGQGKL